MNRGRKPKPINLGLLKELREQKTPHKTMARALDVSIEVLRYNIRKQEGTL